MAATCPETGPGADLCCQRYIGLDAELMISEM